jgi:hypothetical protein
MYMTGKNQVNSIPLKERLEIFPPIIVSGMQERHNRADELFEELFISETVDYFTFMLLIDDEARKWDLQRESSNLNKLISNYIHEFRQTPSGLFTEYFLSDIKGKPSIEAIELRRKLQKLVRDNKGTSP